MSEKQKPAHPYIPNSAPNLKKAIMDDLGINDIEQLYEDIPEKLRFRGELKIPEPILSELEVKKHVLNILSENVSCEDNLSFLGGGCAQHYVPAIVDEVVNRSEFLTAYAGEPYEDHGRFQALFEYQSLMAELLDMDVVNVPTYDWGQAASTSVRMAERITGRGEVLISEFISDDRFKVIKNYCEPVMKVSRFKHDPLTGQININDLSSKIDKNTACVYFENPSFFGIIEEQGDQISEIIHKNGSIMIVGTDPISLGVLKPPSHYGADIVCGDIQTLGNHMYFGGSLAGFIATRDDKKFVAEYPSRLFGIAHTSVEGEWGFGDVLYDRTSFGEREKGKEFVGTAAALYGIAAAVYLSLMGPEGMKELGQTIIQRALYAKKQISEIPGVKIKFNSANFKEFVVDFSDTGKDVEYINQKLRELGIFGGHSLEPNFPDLKNCALYCVTEIHSKNDIDRLVNEIRNIV
ncbi:aminomethyl-transferring glycine dehydrogenase subunit GcvPA [candidate division KSB1 bacterium]|nr:MAG: aminomethyl-transferring glycine dehydrogenase subunit GcvPA [candidate division KSB1 bacterium]